MATRDPYLQIAIATEFVDHLRDYDPSDPLDFLLELAPGGAERLREFAWRREASVNTAHLDAGSRFATARMWLASLERLEAEAAITGVELAENLRHQRSVWPERRQRQDLAREGPPLEVRRRSDTLLAIIDDGCPFAHAQYRVAGSAETRIVALWDMDPDPELYFERSASPAGFHFGREVPGTVLNRWIRAHSNRGEVDESACYSGRYSAVAPELTHGSHLLGRLAGRSYSRSSPGPDVAADADIAFVQLPRAALETPGAGAMHACILDALRYLRQLAEKSSYRRCVVACAMGSALGPHDGSALFDRALQALLGESGQGRTRFDIVFAAGNGYQDQVHAVLSPSAGRPASVKWMLPSENEAATFADLWIDGPPWATSVCVDVGAGDVALADGSVTAVSPWLTAVRQGPQIALRAAPTRVSEAATQAAQPGGVTIRVGTQASAQTVHGYLCWGGKNLGYRRETRQARWSVPPACENTVLDGHGSLVGDACGMADGIWVVGGYVGANDDARLARASYSAAGPSRGARRGPDFLAMAELNSATQGIPGPGTRTGLAAWVWGTSVAVPQAARALANGEALPQRGSASLGAVEEVGAGYLRP